MSMCPGDNDRGRPEPSGTQVLASDRCARVTSGGGTSVTPRPNDLVFNYLVSRWLLGQDPPAVDMLAWNDDATGSAARYDSGQRGRSGRNADTLGLG